MSVAGQSTAVVVTGQTATVGIASQTAAVGVTSETAARVVSGVIVVVRGTCETCSANCACGKATSYTWSGVSVGEARVLAERLRRGVEVGACAAMRASKTCVAVGASQT